MDEERKTVLLRALYQLMKIVDESPVVLNILAQETTVDGEIFVGCGIMEELEFFCVV